MKRFSVAIALACAVGCGSSGGGDSGDHVCSGAGSTPDELGADYAPNFAGTWHGWLTEEIAGRQLYAGEASLVVSRTGENTLDLGGSCGMPALVTSASTFETVCRVCQSHAECGDVSITYSAGTATLSGSTLDMILSGTAEGCGQTGDFRLTFRDASREPTAAAGPMEAQGIIRNAM